jgi:ribonuclease HI
MDSIEVYTDGACKGNPGVGGWGVVTTKGGEPVEFYGSEPDTTNNRMELTAAIKALQISPKTPTTITIFTDSQYVKNGITQWIKNWKKNGWKTAANKPVKNQDLWVKLDGLMNGRDVEWRWVRGHNDNPGNERADQLANKGIEQLLGLNGL